MAQKVATVARFRLGFSTFLSENATVTWFRCEAEHIPLVSARWKLESLQQLSSHWVVQKLFQCEFCAGTTCAPGEPAVAKPTDSLTMFKLRGW